MEAQGIIQMKKLIIPLLFLFPIELLAMNSATDYVSVPLGECIKNQKQGLVWFEEIEKGTTQDRTVQLSFTPTKACKLATIRDKRKGEKHYFFCTCSYLE